MHCDRAKHQLLNQMSTELKAEGTKLASLRGVLIVCAQVRDVTGYPALGVSEGLLSNCLTMILL